MLRSLLSASPELEKLAQAAEDEQLVRMYERLTHEDRRRFFTEFNHPYDRLRFLLVGGSQEVM